MPSDLERIRELALRETARKRDEWQKNQDFQNNEARRLAREHLPLWVNSIERVIQQGANLSINLTFEVHQGFFGIKRRWLETSSDLAPSIDLDKLVQFPIHTYTEELTLLLGKPFVISVSISGETMATFNIQWDPRAE